MDLPHIVRRVVHQINPLALVLMECELWPNMLRMLKNRNVPVFVVNGRISDGSYRGYRKVRFFFQRAVAWIDCLMVQSAVDEQRLLDLGALPEQLVVTGSAKYDTAVPDGSEKETAENVLAEAGMNHRGALLVAGSTWPGEEKALLEIFEALRLNQPDLQLILVPRHMERRAEVEALLRASGLSYIKRTDMTGSDTAGDDRVPPLVLLADTTGELKNYYSIATLVFVGKSLGDNRGGQNPIEPAMFGKAVVVGPHMENFPGVMDDFLAAKALVQVTDERELRQRMAELLEKQELRSGYGSRAAELVASKRGAVARSVALIKQIVSESEQGRCA
jgi:3-deoxy-D-manno-octulosonic-acid transferase